MITDLRTIVQETFTALLASTSAPHTTNAPRTDVSFLRILRSFLNRASLSSPSLSNLRAVLSAIFSAYSYEESLLSLANRLLDKDLFVHVTEADTLRRRGWRPLGQVCEACGKRVWGPGAGGYIWDAWLRGQEERESEPVNHSGKSPARSSSSSREIGHNGKGKAATRDQEHSTTDDEQIAEQGDNGAVVIFSCRHLFHRACLVKMQEGEIVAVDDDRERTTGRSSGPDLVCPLCT